MWSIPTVSNEAGVYVLPQMVPGPYKITVSKEGFQTLVRSEITLRIGDRATINFELKPGEIQTTVDVTATAELLTTDDATYSTTLDNAMITALPQLSRNTLDLTRVTPGVQGLGPRKLDRRWRGLRRRHRWHFLLAGGRAEKRDSHHR